jgi:hypothetical protein
MLSCGVIAAMLAVLTDVASPSPGHAHVLNPSWVELKKKKATTMHMPWLQVAHHAFHNWLASGWGKCIEKVHARLLHEAPFDTHSTHHHYTAGNDNRIMKV